MFTKITVVPLQKTLMKVSPRLEKRLVCYLLLILTNPMVYLKFWKQSCIPTHLFRSELWTLTPTLLNKLEACQRWFLKKLFHLPEHAPNHSLYIISGLLTIETLIDQRKLFFLLASLHHIRCLLWSIICTDWDSFNLFSALKIISQAFLKTQLIAWLNMGLSLTLNSGHEFQFFLHILVGKELLIQSYLPLRGQGLTPCHCMTEVHAHTAWFWKILSQQNFGYYLPFFQILCLNFELRLGTLGFRAVYHGLKIHLKPSVRSVKLK